MILFVVHLKRKKRKNNLAEINTITEVIKLIYKFIIY